MNRKINSKEFVIMHVGRFEIAKGVINLINVFIDIAKENPNIKLLLVGEYRGDAKGLCLTKIKMKILRIKSYLRDWYHMKSYHLFMQFRFSGCSFRDL